MGCTLRLTDFDYDLPTELIAKYPTEPRDHCRLLVINRNPASIKHARFFQIADWLQPGDLLVLNNTKVIPARLFGYDGAERKYEILLLKPLPTNPLCWSCLVRPGKKICRTGLSFLKGIRGIVERIGDDSFQITFRLLSEASFFEWLARIGSTPLPHYIGRPSEPGDKESYQTVYAKVRGSVAAPTAGLHFTEELLTLLKSNGVGTVEITLRIGYGTFAPIRAGNIENHAMHSEYFEIPEDVFEKIKNARKSGGRIIAVGTTTVRALESVKRCGLSGETNLFIRPGHTFRRIDGLITNFHLPKSSLYVLVSSFLGAGTTRGCYQEAIAQGYRFYSYGDAMAIF